VTSTIDQARSDEPLLQSHTLDQLLRADQGLLDALPVGFYACDADGQILRVNQKAVQLWGCAPKLLDPVQRFCGSFRVESLDGQFIPPHQTPMAHVLRTGNAVPAAEAIVINPDGKRWVTRVQLEPIRDSSGGVLGAINCFQDITPEYQMRQALQQQQRSFNLAMIAANMGTWRYTLADNICVYDENAQRLYGLTEARFLHDEEGARAKFHPDDMALMWERVGTALDPNGDGRYEVEYRVKQRDGSWRWLSAWGYVEFVGSGPDRKAVAITGASRDLTELKNHEEVQRLLTNELQHRVKNNLTVVQSLASQTLRTATDLEGARLALEARIMSLARAHDALTKFNHAGADVREVISQAMQPFANERIVLSGPEAQVSPKCVQDLSLGLHELATNATKYGALSVVTGTVTITWDVRDGELHLAWDEAGGPPVTKPKRQGFGGRLLQVGLFGGNAKLDYRRSGVRCEIITAA
jgi:PAS domain S-box-containing protein